MHVCDYNVLFSRVIALGEHTIGKNPDFSTAADVIYRGIEEIIIHEKYDKNLQKGASPYDIALIRVKRSIPLYDPTNTKLSNVSPICLPWNRNDPGRELDSANKEDTLRVLGWGHITNDERFRCFNFRAGGAGTPLLQQLDVPFISWRQCKEKAGLTSDWVYNEESQLCAGGEVG